MADSKNTYTIGTTIISGEKCEIANWSGPEPVLQYFSGDRKSEKFEIKGFSHGFEKISEIYFKQLDEISELKAENENLKEMLASISEQNSVFKLDNHCMIGQTWFMKGTPVANLIKHAEQVYRAEAIAQNSKIEFGTDDNRSWFAHDVPFFGTVQMDQYEEHGIVEWDIHFNECWQGPFNSKARCIQHLEECIQEMREEQAQEG
ncbi:hypothetical protein SAMN02799632_00854 [Acinetobacter pittii]|uniref:hypothetical protein n=1 Tax=Acinetobacter calcoaceticus/baumannii complex TaxID=909768 RepID=UPI0008D001C9|nr:hypothetical protein [Acinetobacter pittii]SEO62218.1 hypothetical protein SAMN02799632_00854 [Acinetobacter pittii]